MESKTSELQKNKEETLKEVNQRKQEIKEEERHLLELKEGHKKTYSEIVKFANRVEHNTKRLNKLYAKGAINIKLDIPLENWMPL